MKKTTSVFLHVLALHFLLGGMRMWAGPEASAPDVDAILETTSIHQGLAVVLGELGSTTLDLVQEGHFLVEELQLEWPGVFESRRKISEAAFFPLANAQFTPTFRELPYAPRLVNLLIADLDALGNEAPSEQEIRRVLVFGGAAYVKSGTWKVIRNPFPKDTDEWSHSLRGPDRVPVSQDRLLQDNVDGMKWIAERENSIEQFASAMLIHDGKHFSIRRSSAISPQNKQSQEWPFRYHLVARDAQNGIALWSRPVAWIPTFNHRNFSQNFNAHWATGNGKVYIYPEIGGHLSALDADTGEIVRVYDQLPALKAGQALAPKRLGDTKKSGLGGVEKAEIRWAAFGRQQPRRDGKETFTPLAEPESFAQSGVFVLGDTLVHSFGNHIWVVDEGSGRILGEHRIKEHIEHSLVGEDGHLYVIAEGTLQSFALPKATLRWTTTFKQPDAVINLVKAFTGPREGVLGIMYVKEGGGTWAKGQILGVDTESGNILWRQEDNNLNSSHLVMVNGLVAVDSWKGAKWYDPRSGEKTGGHDINFDMGGCSFPTYTPDFMIRGLTLHSLQDPNQILISDGARGNCQNPIYPAYGQLFSFGAKRCGCSVFYRSGIGSFYAAPELRPTPDKQRLYPQTPTVFSGTVSGSMEQQNIRIEDWQRGQGFFVSNKQYNYKKTPAVIRKAQRNQLSKGMNLYNASKKTLSEAGWTISSSLHSNVVEIQGHGKSWTLLLGGRLMADPLVVGEMLYLGANSGWVHAFNLAEGRLVWSYQASPMLRRMVAFGQVESAWPVVAVQKINGFLVVVAGRRNSFDDGIHIVGLDPASGRKAWQQVIGTPQKQFRSISEATRAGYSGFGAKNSTLAFRLYQGQDENTWWMVGSTPVKIPAAK